MLLNTNSETALGGQATRTQSESWNAVFREEHHPLSISPHFAHHITRREEICKHHTAHEEYDLAALMSAHFSEIDALVCHVDPPLAIHGEMSEKMEPDE